MAYKNYTYNELALLFRGKVAVVTNVKRDGKIILSADLVEVCDPDTVYTVHRKYETSGKSYEYLNLTDVAQLYEMSPDAYESVQDIFGAEEVDKLRSVFGEHPKGSLYAANYMRKILNANGILAELLTFRGVGEIKVYDRRVYFHTVLLLGECLIDILNSDDIILTRAYITKLESDNSNIHIDNFMSSGWWNENGYHNVPTLKELKALRF